MPQIVTLHLDPRPKPRITHQGRFSETAKRYYAYANTLRAIADHVGVTLSRSLSVTFVLPMPKSWSKSKRQAMNGQAHEVRPDLKNLVAALEDILYNRGERDDSEIHTYRDVRKVWGEQGAITIHDEQIS